MGSNRFGNGTPAACFLAGQLNRILADVPALNVAWKEPVPGLLHSPPVAQDLTQLRRQHHVAVFLTLTLVHTNDHPGAVNIRDGEANHFRDSEPGSIAGR